MVRHRAVRLLAVMALAVFGVALPVSAHEEAEVEFDNGEFEVKVDRPLVSLGDEIELEAEFEYEVESEDEEDVESDDEEDVEDEEEEDVESDDEQDVEDEGSGDASDDEENSEIAASSEHGSEGDTTSEPGSGANVVEVPSTVTFTVDYGDGTVGELTTTKQEREIDEEDGEGEFEAEASGTHTYAALGTYTVVVTATPDVGEAVSAELAVEVVEEPVAYGRDIDDVCPDDDDEEEDEEEQVDPVDPVDPAAGTPSFDDVDASSVHAVAVNCLVERGVAAGKGNGRFGAGEVLSRAQFATMLANLIQGEGLQLPEGADHFDDDDDSVHEEAINLLAEAGIITGNGASFHTDAAIGRGQMAAMLLRALEYIEDEAVTTETDYFTDDDGIIHEDAIDAAAAAGLATGKGLGVFDPGSTVKREQVSTFLARLLSLLQEQTTA